MPMREQDHYDAIVIGSGTCGASVARELSAGGQRVLLLERGGPAPVGESVMGFVAIADQVKVGDKLATARALTTGGSTSMYFGVVNYPPLDEFRKLGLDISAELEEVKRELPIAPLPDRLIGEQSQRLRESALALGHDWNKHDMLIDATQCEGDGYSYRALWRARRYVEDAVEQGTQLVRRATVGRVLREGDRAIGVQYRIRKPLYVTPPRAAYAPRIVLAAGELASPQILRASGLDEVGRRGFYCSPGYALYGLVPGLQARDNFVGSMGCDLGDGIELGDANVSRFMHRLMMLGKGKFKHLRNYPQSIGIGVKVKDGHGGELRADGRLHKTLDAGDRARLERGEREARRVLEQAGAQQIFNFGLAVAGRVGGMVAIGEHVDARLETRLRGLHVCDGSVIPDAMRGTPTVTLLSMARHLSKHLLRSA